jgi:hypothetical protein
MRERELPILGYGRALGEDYARLTAGATKGAQEGKKKKAAAWMAR